MISCRTLRRLTTLLVTALCGCSRPGVGPTPVVAVAPFVAVSPNNSRTPPRNECWMAGRFQGMAYLRGSHLELVVPSGWIAVTRDNDKQSDDLHLLVELHAHRLGDVHWPPLSSSIPVVLRPTVDSAGPQLTTWQSADTLHLFVPWVERLGPRWLAFQLQYSTLSHTGGPSRCEGSLGTDTLRFAPARP